MLGCWARGWTVNKWRLFSYRWMWFHHHVADALVRVQIAREKTTWSDHFINMIVALISATINDVPRSSYWKGRIQASSFPYMQPGSHIYVHISFVWWKAFCWIKMESAAMERIPELELHRWTNRNHTVTAGPNVKNVRFKQLATMKGKHDVWGSLCPSPKYKRR